MLTWQKLLLRLKMDSKGVGIEKNCINNYTKENNHD